MTPPQPEPPFGQPWQPPGVAAPSIPASYYDGQTAARHDALVIVDVGGLRVRTVEGERFWPYAHLQRTQGAYSGEIVRLEFGIEAVTVADTRILQAIEAHRSTLGKGAYDPDAGTLGTLALIVVGLVVLLGLFYWFGLPRLGAFAARFVPVSFESELGRIVSDQLSPPHRTCNDEDLNEAVRAMARRLESADPSRYRFHIKIAKEETVNALAGPGGHIVLFRGLIAKTSDPDELASVLAHEMQHVIQQHSTKAILRQAGTGALLALIGGDISKVAGLATELTGLRFQRNDESSADAEGIKMMARAGFNPDAAVRMFRKLQDSEGDMPKPLTYLSTHPATADRVKAMQEAARRVTRGAPASLPLKRSWLVLRYECDASGPRR
jgi:beta-barrel assembly-enhancing protease